MLSVANTKYIDLIFSKTSKLYQIFIVLLGSVFIALFAQFTIPLFPVSATLQNFAVLLMGAVFGPKVGRGIVLIYLLEGLCGLPVFINLNCGFAYLLGPTGGYLIGYPFAAYLTGYLLQHDWLRNYLLIFTAFLLGDIFLFTSGYLHLASLIGYHNAYQFGVVPFYLIELFKLLLLTLTIAPFSRKIRLMW